MMTSALCETEFPSACTELQSGGGKTMSATDVGLRWARELRRQYGGTAAAKRIARDFGVEVRTAAAWMQGGVPFVRHLCRAADLFGAAFVLRVLSPDSELAGCADVDQAIDVLRRRVDDLNRRIARLKGGA